VSAGDTPRVTGGRRRSATGPRPYTTVTKATEVLSAFSYAEPVLGVSELSRRLGIGKSTVYRLLTTLVRAGWVEQTPDSRYRLSLKVYEIGQQVVAGLDLREVAHTPLEVLRTQTGLTTHVAVLDVPDVVYVDRFESPGMVSVSARLGRRRPAHGSSAGKVLLAFGDRAKVDAVVRAGLARLGPRTIRSRSSFERALAEVRRLGHAISVEESAAGMSSIAAPVFDATGACTAAVAVSGPPFALPEEDHPRIVRLVVATAAEISRDLVARQRG
jgi:DNA-binding IclR family transcriptional regulator